MPHRKELHSKREKRVEALIVAAAATLAVLLARPYAGSWNDGSRLATVESLVDRHTWIIDDSIFVKVPLDHPSGTPLPYPTDDLALLTDGTKDKLFIGGHYYSDKSPVPALLMAGAYQLWQWTTGCTARGDPAAFCRAMTLSSSGLAYVLAIWCMYRVFRHLGLALSVRLLLTASLAVATVALPYARHVNNHILLLAVAAALTLGVIRWCAAPCQDRLFWQISEPLGFLAGLAYTIDLGAGPVLFLCTAFVIVGLTFSRDPKGSAVGQEWWDRRLAGRSARLRLAAKRTIPFVVAASPWLVLHHALNYAIGGSFKPANANATYFNWPGCPFDTANLTGSWIHPDLGSFLLYAASMLAGKRGFFGHNLPLFLIIPAGIMLLRRQRQQRREVLWAVGCFIGTWLLYAATSNNSSGQCCTIRWFVPLLAPSYLLLALLLRHFPHSRRDLLILTGWGMILVVLMREGPWMGGMVRFFWPIQAAALGSWFLSRLLRRAALETATKHPYTNAYGNSTHSGAAAILLWTTIPSSSEAHANTISATSTSTCRATNSSSSPA